MTYTLRNTSVYTLDFLHTGSLLQENGDLLLQENGDQILIDNPTQNPNLTTRDVSSFAAYPTRN